MTTDGTAAIHDRLAITDVLYACAAALDARDWDLLGSCFLHDAVEEFSTGARVDGCTGIVAYCQAALAGLDATQHLVSNVRIDLAGDGAAVRSYFQAQHLRADADGGPTFTVGGSYEDEFVRTAEGWRIAARRLVRSWTSGNPAVMAVG